MQGADIWLTPLILLPGIALLIMSTATRYGQLEGTFRQIFKHDERPLLYEANRMVRRLRRFRTALAWLYLSAALSMLATLAFGVFKLLRFEMSMAVFGLSLAAIIALVIALFILFLESTISLDVNALIDGEQFSLRQWRVSRRTQSNSQPGAQSKRRKKQIDSTLYEIVGLTKAPTGQTSGGDSQWQKTEKA